MEEGAEWGFSRMSFFILRMTTVLHGSCQEHGLTRHLETSQQQGKACGHWELHLYSVLKRN
jgi:hypothetical protein